MKKDSENSIRILNNIVNGLYSSTVTNQPDALPLNTKEKVLRVAVGSDHGGFEAKEKLKVFLKELGYRVTDVGTYNTESVDYPDFALKVALKVKSGDCERGIMIDGAGIG
jgi:ribose 5-phosphate isomerase B